MVIKLSVLSLEESDGYWKAALGGKSACEIAPLPTIYGLRTKWPYFYKFQASLKKALLLGFLKILDY